MEHQRGCPASCGVPADGLQVGGQIPGGGFRQGGKTARRDPTESPVGYPSASYARSSCCVGSAWGATGLPERCISRARRSTGVLRRLGLQRLSRLEPVPDPNRYEWPHPGDLLQHLDTKELGRMGTTCSVLRRAVRRLVRRVAGWNIERLVCWTRSFEPDRAIPATASHPARCNAAGQRAISVAEADGNRTRRRALARPPILKACPALAVPSGPVTSVFVFGRRPRTCKRLVRPIRLEDLSGGLGRLVRPSPPRSGR
jgi:hypothetical protein